MNIVISSHSLHSQSSSTGRLGEPRNAELLGMRVCMVGGGDEYPCWSCGGTFWRSAQPDSTSHELKSIQGAGGTRGNKLLSYAEPQQPAQTLSALESRVPCCAFLSVSEGFRPLPQRWICFFFFPVFTFHQNASPQSLQTEHGMFHS